MTRRKVCVVIVLALLVLAGISWQWWLPLPGRFLVESDQPARSDAIVVLAGDGFGYRIQAGAELAKQGFAPVVLVSGSQSYYGLWECDLAIDFAVRNGQPRDLFQSLPNSATSTDAEMEAIFVEARKRSLKSLLIVTSDYHTRRSRMLAKRKNSTNLRLTVYGAPDRYFRADTWWWDRESRKILLSEWTKLGAAAVGGL